MINRRNYKMARAYLKYLSQVRQLNDQSVGRYWSYLKHLLIWADETLFTEVPSIQPTFSTFLSSYRKTADGQQLARPTAQKIIQTTKRFFNWLVVAFPKPFRRFARRWISELAPPRIAESNPDHEFVTLEEVKQLVAIDAQDDLALWRDQAGAALLFLSGMRSSAFGSLPIQCLDPANRAVRQWPQLGVRTKKGKSATTYLLKIPELLEVVERWDAYIRPHLPPTTAWYTPLRHQWGSITLSCNPPGKNRNQTILRRMRKLWATAGLPYKSPHKFRHGHAVYGLQHARTAADYKAVSQNLMHANLLITDGIYARLAKDEVRHRIAGLTSSSQIHDQSNDLIDSTLATLSEGDLSELLVAIAKRLAS